MASAGSSAPTGTVATRRRGKELENAILAATIEQLRAGGYAGLTMEKIAAAAGTGKAALYRRWSNREELLAAALRYILPDPTSIPLTGRVREDLLGLLTCVRDAIALTHGAVFQVVRDEVADAGGMLHSVVGQRVMDPCRELILEVLRNGVRAGELRPGVDSEPVVTVGPAMIVHWVVHTSPNPPDSYLASVVDEILVPLTRR